MGLNLLQRGDRMLGQKASAAAAETVRVLRGEIVLCEAWTVFFGTTRIEVQADGQVTVVGERHDWIGDPSELRLEGERVELQQGDACEWLNGDYLFTFSAQPADGENVSSPHGPYGSRIRSHWVLRDWRRNEPA